MKKMPVVEFRGVKATVPSRIWECVDCNTLSDNKTASHYHLGCAGYVRSPKVTLFAEKKVPVRASSGEIVWLNKDEA